MTTDLRREIGRKTFHMLSLVYLGAFHLIGWPLVGRVMAVWLPIVFVIETMRLKVPEVERFLFKIFDGMIRDTERRHFSGIFHTTAGSLAAMLIARGEPMIVGAAILQLALGDAASALAGKAFGRTKLFGGRKSLEGTLAGFSVGFAAAVAYGLPPRAAFATALTGALTELLPTTPWFNDNLWVPVASASILRLMGAK